MTSSLLADEKTIPNVQVQLQLSIAYESEAISRCIVFPPSFIIFWGQNIFEHEPREVPLQLMSIGCEKSWTWQVMLHGSFFIAGEHSFISTPMVDPP